ncbi:MAG TPA: polysaccharide biosynthesis/export family protein [Gemmatimonadaceae bacterium]|nr:polysaccharide biosynthesis/export family protein [Gemmatimonadaceae bacterium]
MRIGSPDGVRRLVVLALGCAVALSASSARAQDTTRAKIVADSLSRSVGVLRPGDAVKIAVFRDTELTGEYLIDSRGQLQIPGLGVIQAAGLDPDQLKTSIRQALIQLGTTNPQIAVQPLVRVSVLGEVRAPALYPVDPGISLIQLLTIAGGPTPNANLRRTRVVREGRVFEVDLESALTGSASGRVVLYSNDVVVVPKKTGFTRETLQFVLGLTTTALSIATLIITVKKSRS